MEPARLSKRVPNAVHGASRRFKILHRINEPLHNKVCLWCIIRTSHGLHEAMYIHLAQAFKACYEVSKVSHGASAAS